MLLAVKHGANVNNNLAFQKKIVKNILSELNIIAKFAPRLRRHTTN